jgi:hypothetical protein
MWFEKGYLYVVWHNTEKVAGVKHYAKILAVEIHQARSQST